MKLGKFSLLLIPALLMSCANDGPTSLGLDEAIFHVISMDTMQSYTHYSVDAQIEIAAFPKEMNSYVSDPDNLEKLVTTPRLVYKDLTLEQQLTRGLISSSYYLGAPLKLSKTNFFKEKVNKVNSKDEFINVDKSDCVYGVVHSLLIYASGSTSSLLINKTESGGMIFSTYNSDTFLTISNVNTFPEYDLYPKANFAGRINGEFEYNNEGYLIREEVWSIHYDATKASTDGSMMRLISTYSYQ